MTEPTSDPTTLELEAAAELPAELEARLEAHPALEGVNVTASDGRVLLVGATMAQAAQAALLAGPAWNGWRFHPDPSSRTLLEALEAAERDARHLAAMEGRGPGGLALSTLATDLWKARAQVVALEAGELPALGD